MKKILITGSLLVILLAVGCNDDKAVAASTVSEETAMTVNSANTYRNQLPYVMVENQATAEEFDEKNSVTEKTEDSNTDWNYFDSLYADTLPGDIKEELGYTILVKKDLIGLLNSSPANATYRAGVKKYIDILVAEKYIGYCALYNAMDALQKADSAAYAGFIKDMKTKIVAYGKEDTWHKDIVSSSVKNSSLDQQSYDKVVENYSYRAKIQTL